MSGGRRGQAGAALLLVFWALVLAASLAAALALSARSELSGSRGFEDLARARHLADGGVHLALALFDKEAGLASRLDGEGVRRAEFTLGGEVVTVALVDETGKVDLNEAPRLLLEAALRAVGLGGRQAEALADAVLDWRDGDNEAGDGGSEVVAYARAGLAYRPRNADFLDIAELLLLPGMDAALFRRLAPFVTVHSGLAAIDPRYAPAGLLRALSAAGADSEAMERLLEVRRAGGDAAEPPPLPPVPGTQGLFTGSHRLAFTIAAEAPLPSGARFRREAVVWLRGDGRQPFAFLAWRAPGHGLAGEAATAALPGRRGGASVRAD